MEEHLMDAPLLGASLEQNESICGICLCTVNAGSAIELDCKHTFHASCAVDWFRTRQSEGRCPICREAPARSSSLAAITEEEEGNAYNTVAISNLFTFSVNLNTLHNTVAPWIYNSARKRDRVLNALINRYMRRRRLHHRSVYHNSMGETSDSEVAKCEKRLLQTGYCILIYLVASNFMHPLA